MKHKILLIILLASVACQRKYICPAFQSSFLLDEQKTEAFFSMFGNDSLPKSNLLVKKNKYGIIVKVKYQKRIKDLETVKMETIFPPPQDTILMAERNIGMDSTALDSLLNEGPQYDYKFNRDQLVYMRHIGSKLQIPESKETEEEELDSTNQVEGDGDATEEEKPKKSWWPFGKKNKEEDTNDEDNLPDQNEDDQPAGDSTN